MVTKKVRVPTGSRQVLQGRVNDLGSGRGTLQPLFDAAWRMEALAGNAEAISRLAHWATGPLYRFCYYRLGQDKHLCEDVVQDTLVVAIKCLGDYDPSRVRDEADHGSAIFIWLTGLARNEIRRSLSHRQSSAQLQEIWMRMDHELLSLYGMLDKVAFEDSLLARSETREMVNTTMSQLPPRYGGVLEAKYILGRSVREIAAGLGHTEKAVESLLGRARQAFRTTFLALVKNLDCPLADCWKACGRTGVNND